jgi:hypothetical protein
MTSAPSLSTLTAPRASCLFAPDINVCVDQYGNLQLQRR